MDEASPTKPPSMEEMFYATGIHVLVTAVIGGISVVLTVYLCFKIREMKYEMRLKKQMRNLRIKYYRLPCKPHAPQASRAPIDATGPPVVVMGTAEAWNI